LAVFLQDPILESYGAEVFGLPIAATASLSAVWGVGTLLGLLLAGLWLVPKLGKFSAARLGCQLILLSLLLLAGVGVLADPNALRIVLFLFGLATGIGTNATLVLMLDLTLPAVAGTFVGVWGLAQAYSRALGKVMGGGLLDAARWVLPEAPAHVAYGLVLLFEASIAVLALVLLSRVSLKQFRADTAGNLDRVLAAELG
jgi:BCD family chlorophyll transporter-like MFS transporter